MAVDKSLNQAPLGLDASLAAGIEPGVNMPEPDMEIEFEDDESDMLDEEESLDEIADEEFNENLAESLDESQLAQLAGDLVGDFEEDVNSRKDWIQTYVDGLELLGMKIEDRTEPWSGACGVYHPLLAEAVVKFQAETMMETFPAQGPVRTKVIYYDPALGRQVAMYVTADDVVVPYGASSLETAERVTHVMRKTPNELKRLQASGFYCDVDIGEPTNTLDEVEKAIAEKLGFRAETDDRYKLLEMHVDLVIEDDKYREESDDGVALPYVVTIDKASMTILSIRRNWDPEDDKKLKRNHFVHYSYVPGFGFYAFGLIHLIGAFAKSGTSIIRQLVDAGTLSNLPGGFKTKGLRVKGDDTPISPAEWRDVDVASGTMRDNIMPLPYKEPSGVLFQLLGTIVEEGRKFAGAADMKISDMSGQAPVGTTLAILERTLKMMSAVQARVHYAMRQEFKLLKGIIRDYTPDSYPYEPEEGSRKAKKSDYDTVEVIPVSDPNAATMAQKIVQYQAVIQLAQMAPQIYDLPYLHRQMLEVLGIKNAQKLVPLVDDEDRKPRDPISENMDVINGKPVKAFIYQDHQAHLAVHMAAMQDPKIQQMLGQNPNAQTMMAAMQAHIAEHLAFEYRKQVEEQAGVPLPPPDSEMDEDTELAVSRLAAIASQQLLQKNQAEAQQQQNQQMAQDPIVQMQMQELQIKQQELQLKAQKFMAEAAEKNDRLDIERERIAAQKEIAGLQVGAKVSTDKANLSAKQQLEGLRIGVQVAKEATAAQQPSAPPKKAETKDK